MKQEINSIIEVMNPDEASVELTSATAKRLAKLNSLIKELDLIKQQTVTLKKFQQNFVEQSKSPLFNLYEAIQLMQGLEYSILVRYFKLFASSKDGSIKLNVKDHLNGAPNVLVQLHEKLQIIRDNHISHGTLEDLEISKVYLALKPDVIHDDMADLELSYPIFKKYGRTIEELEQFVDLIDLVSGNVRPSLEKAEKKVWEEVHQHKPEYWLEEAAKLKPGYVTLTDKAKFTTLFPKNLETIKRSEAAKKFVRQYVIENSFGLDYEAVRINRIVRQTFKDFPHRVTYWLDNNTDPGNLIASFEYNKDTDTVDILVPLPQEEVDKVLIEYRRIMRGGA